MIACIGNVLSAEEIKKLRDEAALLPFVPGAETAGGRARRVKNNEQVSQKAEERKVLHEVVISALMRNKDFNRAALPKRIRPPLISRYRQGMAYGQHVDNALMGPKQARERSDGRGMPLGACAGEGEILEMKRRDVTRELARARLTAGKRFPVPRFQSVEEGRLRKPPAIGICFAIQALGQRPHRRDCQGRF